jgi:iron complex outermembrane receptor protein
MSELTNTHNGRNNFRGLLLTSVSALALVGVTGVHEARADDDTDKPVVWIELGAQFERAASTPEIFALPFFDKISSKDVVPMIDAQQPLPFSIGGEGKISFEPEGTDWVLSASVRYGRSSGARHLHRQPQIPGFSFTFFGQSHPVTVPSAPFGDGQTELHESHAILDFQAGKDVGLGMFGARGSSVVSVGVRFAQFTASSDTTLHARSYGLGPPHTRPGVYKNLFDKYHANYTAFAHTARNARALGPSISWDASLPVLGNSPDMTVNFDWGANVAVLFGRQRAIVHHQTKGNSVYRTGPILGAVKHTAYYTNLPPDQDRVRSATILNVGGFAGVSFRYMDAKLSFGYRADLFFNAMDGGIDTAHRENIGFYGPFAAISVGIGD